MRDKGCGDETVQRQPNIIEKKKTRTVKIHIGQ